MKFAKVRLKATEIMTARAIYVAEKGQHFQTSERGQAWELWQDEPELRFIRKWPRSAVLMYR